MNHTTKACVLTAHNKAGWYHKGQKRLINSLHHHGFSHDIVSLQMSEDGGGWFVEGQINGQAIKPYRNNGYPNGCPYTLKAVALEFVMSQGYDVILWLDCSVYLVQKIEPVFDHIEDRGHYFWRSGYSVGHTASDRCLDYFGLNRNEAFEIPDSSTSMFGVKLANPDSLEFANEFLRAAKNKIFHGPRDQIAAGTASDKIQLFAHRQDQSVASCLVHLIGLTYTEGVSQYANDKGEYPETVRLVMRGL